jgi:hypothetical protein
VRQATSKKSDGVAKLFVKVKIHGDTYYLFSRKNAPGHERHDHLELLGGKIKEMEDVLDGAIRELREEEITHSLAKRLSRGHLTHEVRIDNIEHYIFEISIPAEEYLKLKRNPKESLSFETVPKSRLHKKKFQSELTKRTRKIFEALL